MEGLEGKSVIVTGGGSGMGEAAVKLLVRSGCRVTIADRNEEGGHRVAAAVADAGGGDAHFIRTDVSDEDSVRAMVDSAVSRYGRVDGAINAAGVPPLGKTIADMSLEEWDQGMAINLRGMFLSIKYELMAMQNTGGGSIVAISSIAAVIGAPLHTDYCSSKAGVTGLVRAVAVDYASKGIRINTILPGGTLTGMSRPIFEKNPGLLEAFLPAIPMGRLAQPEEIASGAVWLVSDLSSFVTGIILPMDGGQAAT